MQVDVHVTCWNEERILPFFLRHYEPLADRIFLYDDGSSDRSLDILSASRKTKIVPFDAHTGPSYIESLRDLYNHCWKCSRDDADWVVIGNVDEHYDHPSGLRRYLRACRRAGVTAIPALGFEMVAESFPAAGASLRATVRRGRALAGLAKTCVFNPNRIAETNFTAGRHSAAMTGDVVLPERRSLRLLHYKWIDVDYVVERYAALASRRRPDDLSRNYGYHYEWPRDRVVEVHRRLADRAEEAMPVKRRHLRPLRPVATNRWPSGAEIETPPGLDNDY